MKISELVDRLNKIKAEHGDLPIYSDATEYHHSPYDFPVDGIVEVRDEVKAEGEFDEWHKIPEPKRVVIW